MSSNTTNHVWETKQEQLKTANQLFVQVTLMGGSWQHAQVCFCGVFVCLNLIFLQMCRTPDAPASEDKTGILSIQLLNVKKK
jgi:hypothetical protein